MTTRIHSLRRRRFARVGLVAVALMALGTPTAAVAAPGSATDPDDVTLRLDLKSLTHADDASTITYTAQTYEDFADSVAFFKWGIDKNGDQGFDLIVFAEWDEGELVAGVDDMAEEPVAEATVSRPSPNTISVSFTRKVLGSATSYNYGALAATDLNDNGEDDTGEVDVAPNSGLYKHELGAPASAPAAKPTPGSSNPPAAAPSPSPSAAPAPRPAQSAKPISTPAPVSANGTVSEPAPAPAAAPQPEAPGSVAPALSAMQQKTTTVPAVQPAAPKPAVQPAAPKPAAPAAAPVPAAPTAPATESPANLARTGAGTVVLALLAGAVLVAGGFLFIGESFVPRSGQRAR